jgi:proteasome assembly chaperone (PAC2) family protein
MADHLRFADRPALTRPVVIAAFEGWNDAGDAATVAAQYLRDRWHAAPFAAIDPEEFYDFTSTRPRVQLDDDGQREIVWPGNEFSAGRVEPAGPDVIVVVGTEPQLKWRTFCEQITDVAASYDARLVVTLGALLAEVAHSKPVSVIGTSFDPDVVEGLGLRRSTYQGPTGIVGVLHDACRRAGLATASLWAAVPTYVSSAPSPKAALALVERTAQLLDVGVVTTDLEIAAASYERQINTLVAADDETAAYVARLESEDDADDDDEDEDFEVDEVAGSPDRLIEEVERFLRDQE